MRKTVRINKDIKLALVMLSEDNESMVATLSRLLDGIEPVDVERERTINMKLPEEVYDKLKSKQGKNEKLIDVVERAINNVSQE